MMKKLLSALACALLSLWVADAGEFSKDVYLDLMEIAVGAYTPEHIQKYMEEVEEVGITEHGYARLVSNIGILLAHGRLPELRDSFVQMMDICAREMPVAREKSGKKRPGNNFAVKEICYCLMELEKAGTFPQSQIDLWRASLSPMQSSEIYDIVPKLGAKSANNWVVYACASECARLYIGLGGDREFADKYLTDQLRWFDENGMYMDPHQPMVYDLVTRLQFMAALSFGYDGPARPAIEENLLKSALPTLQMQSVTGEIPYGGRSNQFLHNETFLAAVCEYYATWMKQRGDYQLASRFRAAARRAVGSLQYWTDQEPVRHIKNRYPTETKYGCEGYAYFDKYMVTMGSWAYLAYHFADDSIQPSEKPEPSTTFVTSPAFHRIMMNGGGYTAEFDLDAQPEYDSSGLGRVQKAGAPPVIALAAPCPADKKPNVTLDVKNEGPLCISPEWKEYELVEARAGKLILTNGSSVWTSRLSRRGLQMTLKGPGLQYLTLPALVFDGESEPEVVCAGKNLTIRFNGWQCTYHVNGKISDSGRVYGSRNGHLRRYDASAKNCLKVQVKIDQVL